MRFAFPESVSGRYSRAASLLRRLLRWLPRCSCVALALRLPLSCFVLASLAHLPAFLPALLARLRLPPSLSLALFLSLPLSLSISISFYLYR